MAPCLCGLQVAQLAGIPKRVTEVAHQAGIQLEESLRVRSHHAASAALLFFWVKGSGPEELTRSFWWSFA